MDQFKAITVALLRRMEWRTGRCPVCGGFQPPSGQADAGQWAHLIGHRKDCELARLMEEAEAH